jgi:hypothetical protein
MAPPPRAVVGRPLRAFARSFPLCVVHAAAALALANCQALLTTGGHAAVPLCVAARALVRPTPPHVPSTPRAPLACGVAPAAGRG